MDLANAAGGAEIHEGMTGNRYFDWEIGDEAATEEALKNARKVVTLKVEITESSLMQWNPVPLLLNMMTLLKATHCIQRHRTCT